MILQQDPAQTRIGAIAGERAKRLSAWKLAHRFLIAVLEAPISSLPSNTVRLLSRKYSEQPDFRKTEGQRSSGELIGDSFGVSRDSTNKSSDRGGSLGIHSAY
jgi:hypothetical protein